MPTPRPLLRGAGVGVGDSNCYAPAPYLPQGSANQAVPGKDFRLAGKPVAGEDFPTDDDDDDEEEEEEVDRCCCVQDWRKGE